MMALLDKLRDWSSFEWLTLAFVVALVALPFLCERRSPESGVAELRIWTAADPEAFRKARKAADEYEVAHPGVKLRLEQVAGDMAQKYLSAMQAGNCADVFWLHWSMLPSYAAKGTLLPLDEFVKADRFDLDDFFSTMVEAYRYKGRLYALPHQGSTQMLIYNKDLFDKAGLKYPDANWTRDDFLEAAKKLTVRDAEGRSVQVGCLPGDWSSWVWSAGGELASDDLAEFRFSDPKTVDGLRFYMDLRNKWKVTTRDMTVRGEDPTKVDSFDSGRIGMQVTGPWVFDGYSKTLKFRWGVSVFPKGPGGRQTRFAGGAMAVWSGSRNKRAAWDYVKHVVSREAGEKDLSGYTEVPARRSLAYGAYSRKPFPCDAKVVLDAVDPESSTVRVWPRSEKWSLLHGVVSGQLELALMGSVSLEDALRAIEERGRAALGHAGSGQPTVAGYKVGWVDYAGVAAIVGGLLAVIVARGRKTLAKSRAASVGARRSNLGYLFLAPNAIGFFAFTLVPLVASLVLAFTDWQMLRPTVRFVGLANFATLLGFHQGPGGWTPNDPDFWHFLYNTLFLMLGIPLSMAASLFLAILVNNKIRGIVAFRALFYLPSLCAGVALLMLWRLMYHADHGLINRALEWIGVEGPNWLQSVAWAKPALMLMGIWTAAGGGSMIIYLAGLQNIPPELYEAAHIDGAGWWARFRHVTWPMLAPTTFFIFTMSIIGGFQGGFNAAYIMTSGGPAGSTTTVAYHIYNVAYTGELLMGYGCAIAWVLFVLVFAVTLLNWRYGGKSATEGWQQ
jgi:multiple sugar transport system permease protein